MAAATSHDEVGKLVREFNIRGATHSSDKEVVWLCRFFGEPFEVIPKDSSNTRKKQWKVCEQYFGKKIRAHFDKQDKRGVPLGKIEGSLIEG